MLLAVCNQPSGGLFMLCASRTGANIHCIAHVRIHCFGVGLVLISLAYSSTCKEVKMDKVVDAGQSHKKKTSSYQKEGPEEQQEHLYKILVIGDFGVGKCTIIILESF